MIKVIKEDGIATLTLNRPEKSNALHPAMVVQIKDALESISTDNEVKALIITGEGNSFCAGADLEHLGAIQNYSSTENEKDSENLAEILLVIYKLQMPIIAAVNGPAIAGGCGLASVCDFIIADSKNAKFGYSEVKIGFVPAIVSIFLVRKIGEGNAKKLLLTSDIINAETAHKLGLADQLSDNVLDDSIAFAKKLMSNSLASYSTTKQMLHDISTMNVDNAVNYCIKLNTISRSSEDFKERIKIFLNK
jgi:methylglutaconyl-CoA hydratase